jgi:hypothetical protein
MYSSHKGCTLPLNGTTCPDALRRLQTAPAALTQTTRKQAFFKAWQQCQQQQARQPVQARILAVDASHTEGMSLQAPHFRPCSVDPLAVQLQTLWVAAAATSHLPWQAVHRPRRQCCSAGPAYMLHSLLGLNIITRQ